LDFVEVHGYRLVQVLSVSVSIMSQFLRSGKHSPQPPILWALGGCYPKDEEKYVQLREHILEI
jgi:hypothetical protein